MITYTQLKQMSLEQCKEAFMNSTDSKEQSSIYLQMRLLMKMYKPEEAKQVEEYLRNTLPK